MEDEQNAAAGTRAVRALGNRTPFRVWREVIFARRSFFAFLPNPSRHPAVRRREGTSENAQSAWGTSSQLALKWAYLATQAISKRYIVNADTGAVPSSEISTN
eukprot:4314199-Pleurochrysis_carterae.AAC.3